MQEDITKVESEPIQHYLQALLDIAEGKTSIEEWNQKASDLYNYHHQTVQKEKTRVKHARDEIETLLETLGKLLKQ